MALNLRMSISTALFIASFVIHSTAVEKCGNYIEYCLTSKRNATGHRELMSNLTFHEGRQVVPDVRLDLQQASCLINGIRQFRISTFISTLEAITAPTGYELVSGLGWYRLHLQPLTWEEARLACEAEGAHLAVLNSPDEAAALKGIFARAPTSIPGASFSHVAHIGFTDLIEGRYHTIFGQTLQQAGFTEWGSSQPNNAAHKPDVDSDCGGIERTGKLNDLPCRSLNAYFCEYPL